MCCGAVPRQREQDKGRAHPNQLRSLMLDVLPMMRNAPPPEPPQALLLSLSPNPADYERPAQTASGQEGSKAEAERDSAPAPAAPTHASKEAGGLERHYSCPGRV